MKIASVIEKLSLSTTIVVLSFFLTASYKNTNTSNPSKTKKVLIFSKTNGFRHESIDAAIIAIKKMGRENNFQVDATEDSLDINPKKLKQYQALIFLNTTGNILADKQRSALQNFLHSGKGFVGIHSATNCEIASPWYTNLIGGIFDSHPLPQPAKLMIINNSHPSTQKLPQIWERIDEWYNFKYLNQEVNVLLKIDESSYKGGKHGDNHPLAWYHDYEGGRAFYTSLGHSPESYSEPLFIQHLLGGIVYAIGK